MVKFDQKSRMYYKGYASLKVAAGPLQYAIIPVTIVTMDNSHLEVNRKSSSYGSQSLTDGVSPYSEMKLSDARIL